MNEKIDVLTPTVPFADIQPPHGGDRALAVIRQLTDEQARYALWCTLALLFGSPESNASEVIANSNVPNFLPIAEAHQILAEIGISRSKPWALSQIRLEVAAMRNGTEATL